MANILKLLRRTRTYQAWRRLSSAQRDHARLAFDGIAMWTEIERTETCDRFFDWVAANPDYEIDSVLMAFLLASTGITVSACRRFFEMRRACAERDAAESQARTLAYRDPLTGMPNRRALSEGLGNLSRRNADKGLGLIFIDLDRFKLVNDMHGHQAGDRLLTMVAERLEAELEPNQQRFRLGGDEFAITAPGGRKSSTELLGLAERVVRILSEPFDDNGLVHHIGASAGIAYFPQDATDGDALARAADVALYSAKQDGRGMVREYDRAMDDASLQRVKLERELREAIRKGEFHPSYQPVVELASGKIVGYEMLARWHRADRTEVGPDRFIPVAEEYGLIDDIFFALLDRVCEETRDWDPDTTVAINISPVQLKDPWLAQKILAALTAHGYPPRRIAVEITENALIADEANARRTILSLKNQGMRIGLDDFGTGYSSLHHLRVLPFDRIKIDKSFISNLDFDAEAQKIVRAIHGLASSLDLSIIAEGIESRKIAEIVRDLGCDLGQGFHYGRPAPAGDQGSPATGPDPQIRIAAVG